MGTRKRGGTVRVGRVPYLGRYSCSMLLLLLAAPERVVAGWHKKKEEKKRQQERIRKVWNIVYMYCRLAL